jgi:hypothetical protein
MSNSDSKEKAKQLLAAPPIVEAPPELLAKAGPLATELDNAAKTATGTLQQVLRIVANVIRDSKSGALTQELHKSMTDAMGRLMTEAKADNSIATKIPQSLFEGVDWLQAYLEARGVPPGGYGGEGAKKPAAAAAPAAQQRPASGKAQDGFESKGSRPMVLPTDDVPNPAVPQKPGQQLESFKAWMKNPSAGKVKG